MNTRLLGTICIIGSILAVLNAFRVSALGQDFDTIDLIVGSFWAVGGIAALVGMIQLSAVGSNTVVRALAFVPIIGFVLLILANIIQAAGLVTTDTNTLAGIGWLAQLAGMVLVGILTIAAKSWQGWRRFVPLLTIVLVPVGFGLGSAIDNLSLGAPIVYLAWILLGYVVVTAEPTPTWQPAVTTS
jgi:hypothetical protein